MRIWVVGDSGRANDDAACNGMDILNLPEHAIPTSGSCSGDGMTLAPLMSISMVFDMYPHLLRSVLWTAIGNHDGSASSLKQTGPYYELFNLSVGRVVSGNLRITHLTMATYTSSVLTLMEAIAPRA